MKKVTSVTLNADGTIKGLLFEGNQKATPMSVVLRMLSEGKDFNLADTDLEVVNRSSGPYLRKKANDTVTDNLGTMATAVVAEEKADDALIDDIKAAEAKSPGALAKLRAFLAGFLG